MRTAYLVILAFLLAAPFILAEDAAKNTAEPSPTTQPAAETPATEPAPQPSAPSSEQANDQQSPATQTVTGQNTNQPSAPASENPVMQPEQQPINPQPAPAQQPAAQPCDQAPTLAADGAGNCKEFSNSCLPPGWSPVGKCPERPPLRQPGIRPGAVNNVGVPINQPVQVPQGCKEVREDSGFVRVVCDAQQAPCPPHSDADVEKCKARNGRPDYFQDQRGCKIFECVFQESESGGFMQPMNCPSEEERNAVSEKCKSGGMNPVTRKDYNGCMFVDCVGSANQRGVACPSENELQKNMDACKSRGGKWISEFDRSGCKVVNCNLGGDAAAGSCKYVPKEAFDNCRNEGGEMIVKEENGCISYANCVKRGDEMSVEYEQVDEVPQSSMLLSLAFKLEQLKIEFGKLSKQTDDIANYYASTGDKNSEERFRKVSSMFIGANQKIDGIKTKMRERITSLTKEDIADFKHDIKYIKEVVIQDILYVMLSTEGGADAAPSESRASPEGCGTDGMCFSKALRTCEKTKFYPEEESGTLVIIEGIEGKNCIIKASVSKSGKNYEMTCKYPNYVMGMGKPEELLPYCEGSMTEMLRQNKNNAPAAEGKKISQPPQRIVERAPQLINTPAEKME